MRSLTLIIVVLLITLTINMPQEMKIGPKTLYRPIINISIAGRKFYRDLEIKLGLDLKGGVHLVYQANIDQIPESDRSQALEATKVNIERRINMLGVTEPVIQTSQSGGNYRIIVELAGIKDVNQAVEIIGQTAQLEFHEAKTATPSSQKDFRATALSGKDLRVAQVQFDSAGLTTRQPVVNLEFNQEGTIKFSEITSRNIGRPLAIVLDNRLITAPIVQTPISNGKAIISGDFTIDEAKVLTIQLNAGSLPVPIKIIEQRNIGATLGSESIFKSFIAGIVGLMTIWLFMVINYGLKGLIANIALVVYLLVSLAIIRMIPVTLTLAGIAGLVLSIGMAVDANILIFERIKEELRRGRPVKSALELGFHRAWNSIRDSNVSSLITASILFWFGSGSIRGFALTLVIGILVSLFSSITVTRVLLEKMVSK